ncbi:4a-hydroxytetrahydrobiopterin dehydratase [Candidatus Pelagibacter sp.]|jgi:4a-hydroxytetrahydrobiopterin dehydratase|nr:4a-hydroxytetrahydrobiopterin dehydratase [Candidatus Pelagibacter sp.]
MSDLVSKKCVPCEGGVLPFDISEIHKYQKKVDGWELKKNEKDVFFLEKKFIFKNFISSQNFVNKIGEISEKENHHPDISFGWGYAKIIITTHAIEGLSENDFILAAKIDQIANV